MCESFLILQHRNEIIDILKHPEKHKYFSININFLELSKFDEDIAQKLLSNPGNTLKEWQDAISTVQFNLSKEFDGTFEMKRNVTCRFHTMFPESHNIDCSSGFPNNEDVDKFIQISGTAIRMTERKLLEFQRQYICMKCKYTITVEAQYDKRNIIKMPKICSNPAGCTCKTIVSMNEGQLNSYDCRDYQEIKLQENLSNVSDKTGPNTLTVTLENDLVNICKPGESVIITGIVKRRWSEFEKGVKIIIDIVLLANHIRICNKEIVVSDETKKVFKEFWTNHEKNELIGRNIILKSIAPELYGLHLVKLAIAIVLAGGCHYDDDEKTPITGMNIRSDSHLLLVGDPGTGKSQMLKFASKILPRSVLTTGVGSTSSGLTVAAVMDGGEWVLEAGALVMSNGGICCIDEFNTMKEHDRTSIHEAMEQQTISVAKAGLVCKLKTRCSILAACNPKGNIDLFQPLCMNVAMSSPLLSRFDLLFLLRDIVNDEQDRKLAEYQLNVNQKINCNDEIWNLNKLKEYYVLIRQFKPKLSTDAETILSTYYQLQRKFSDRNMSRTTVRLLESLVRLSQGHAKLLFHTEVHVIDAIFAIILVDTSLDYNSSILQLKVDNNSFLDKPTDLYRELLIDILKKLNLDEIYQNECDRLVVNSQYLDNTSNNNSTINNESSKLQNSTYEHFDKSADDNSINASVHVQNQKMDGSLDSGYESRLTCIENDSNISNIKEKSLIRKCNEENSIFQHIEIEKVKINLTTEQMMDKCKKNIQCSSGIIETHHDKSKNEKEHSTRQLLSQKYENMKDLDLDINTDHYYSFKNINKLKLINTSNKRHFKCTDKSNMGDTSSDKQELKKLYSTTSKLPKSDKKTKLDHWPKPNDDFLDFNIDLDFQYISQTSTSSQNTLDHQNSIKINKHKENKSWPVMEPKKTVNPYMSILSKYEFVPFDDKNNEIQKIGNENEKSDKSCASSETVLQEQSMEKCQLNVKNVGNVNEQIPTSITSTTTIRKSFKFKRLNSVLNMSKLSEDIAKFDIPNFAIQSSQSANKKAMNSTNQTDNSTINHEQTIFDMSQNSAAKYIRNKFSFNRDNSS